MNTTGWIRGYISHNSENDKFFLFVTQTIGKEFNCFSEFKINGDSFNFKMDKYNIEIPIDKVKELQRKGPYCLDKYILEFLKEHGLEFQVDKSQYIRYCYGLID